jgi:hypothetical protein
MLKWAYYNDFPKIVSTYLARDNLIDVTTYRATRRHGLANIDNKRKSGRDSAARAAAFNCRPDDSITDEFEDNDLLRVRLKRMSTALGLVAGLD